MIAAEPKTTGQYQPYPEYKDSGVEWLGEVPTNWSVATLRHALAGIKNGSTATQLDEGIDTVQISRIETISTGEINHDKVGFVEFVDALHHYRLNVGDILFSHINSLPMVGNIAQFCSKIPLYHGMNLLRLQPSAKVESRYLYWWLKSTFSRQSVESLAKPAINQASIAIDQIKSIPCLYPMWDEQCIIAAFLDYETARIDRLIAQQQRLIELLKEKRQAVISHAVTKGLNPNAPIKDSGVEWLGQVPEHWVVSDLSYTLSAIADIDHYMPESVDIGVPYLMTGDLKNFAHEIDFSECKQVSYVEYGKLSRKIQASIGDVIVARYATIGTATYVDIDKEFLVSYACVTVKPNLHKVAGLYLYYFIKSHSFLEGLLNKVNTNTQGNVGINDLKKVKISLPDVQEQGEVVLYLESITKKIDSLSRQAERAITLMNERRTALISAAVTGKIDLRGWTAPTDEVAA
ncbi:restriction endonuclease subunit S [Aeromonas caviae]